MSHRVLLMQGIIPPYRIPVFRGLARRCDLTVLHSGEPVGSGFGFREVVVRERIAGGLHFQSGIAEQARRNELVIAMFDLRWPSMALPLLGGGRPFFWWGHGFGDAGWLRPLRAGLARRASGLVLYDAAPAADFAAHGVAPEAIFVAPNTVEVAHPTLPEGPDARRAFVYVGRLQPRKRLDILIDAFARAAPGLPRDVGVEIVGDGPIRGELMRRARDAGIGERVVFHGELRDEERLRAIFARALAYVSPGHVGLGVLHSFAHGVAAVTCSGGGHAPEIANLRDGENGLRLPLHSEAFAAALLRLGSDPGEAHRLGAAAHAHYVGHRTLDHMLAGFEAAIRYGLEGPGA